MGIKEQQKIPKPLHSWVQFIAIHSEQLFPIGKRICLSSIVSRNPSTITRSSRAEQTWWHAHWQKPICCWWLVHLICCPPDTNLQSISTVITSQRRFQITNCSAWRPPGYLSTDWSLSKEESKKTFHLVLVPLNFSILFLKFNPIPITWLLWAKRLPGYAYVVPGHYKVQ